MSKAILSGVYANRLSLQGLMCTKQQFAVSKLIKFYMFCINFGERLPLYVVDWPTLMYPMFYQNNNFRKRFIASILQDKSLILKQREPECLYWLEWVKQQKRLQ